MQSGHDWLFNRGRSKTLAAYESCTDLSVIPLLLVDSHFDFISASHKLAADVNNRGSLLIKYIKKYLGSYKTSKPTCLKLN